MRSGVACLRGMITPCENLLHTSLNFEATEREQVKSGAVGNIDEVRESIRVQAKIVALGAALGFTIWVPASDGGRVMEQPSVTVRDKLVTTLPLNYNVATLQTVEENIDVIWLERTAIAHAF